MEPIATPDVTPGDPQIRVTDKAAQMGVKQLLEAIFRSDQQTSRFSRVVLVEYPRKGIWSLGMVAI